jgi:hypothetical protein
MPLGAAFGLMGTEGGRNAAKKGAFGLMGNEGFREGLGQNAFGLAGRAAGIGQGQRGAVPQTPMPEPLQPQRTPIPAQGEDMQTLIRLFLERLGLSHPRQYMGVDSGKDDRNSGASPADLFFNLFR